jgi:DNA-binding transcriptional LysR family regulator
MHIIRYWNEMLLDPRLLRTFVAIVETGRFTLAAKRLNSTQSTVSQHLGKLETAVGHRLIERADRPVGPTPAGGRLLGYARRLLTLQEEAKAILADPAGTTTIRIGVPDDIVNSAMSRQFAQFAERHREIRLDVTTGLSRDLTRRFRAGEFDIAIVKEAVPSGDARASFAEPLAWFEATDRAQPWPDPIPLVTFPPGGLYRDLMIERIERAQMRWYIAFTGNSLGSVLSAVEAGLGLSVIPNSTTASHAVQVSTIFPAEPPLVLSIYAWESGGTTGELVNAMTNTLFGRSK